MLINVQFLRFIAAFLVVLYHAARHVRMSGADPGPLFAVAEATGFAGVDVFFVISGFIMVFTTRSQAGAASSLEFLKRRLARIYSGYWPFFILAAVVFAWARPEHFGAASLLKSFMLWPAPLDQVLLDVSWTLSYEMYFYLVFGALVILGVAVRSSILGGIFLLVTAYNLLRHFAWQDFSPEQYYYNTFYDLFLTSPFLIEFFAGALLAIVLQSNRGGNGWLLLTVGVAGFAAAGMSNVFIYDGNVEQGFHVVPRVLMFGAPSVFLIWGLVNLERSGHIAAERFSLAAGGASYAIYLSHTILLVATMKMGLNAGLRGLPDALVQSVFLLYSALIVVLCITYYQHAERPLHGVFKKLLRVSRSR